MYNAHWLLMDIVEEIRFPHCLDKDVSMFSQLEQEWKSICDTDPSLELMLEEKISPLLNHKEEEFVIQGMNLLEQLGSSALVFILEQKNGSFEIPNRYSGIVRVLERCVILEVSKEDSDWFGLFNSGSFDAMNLRTMENRDWNELSDTLQQRLLKEVRQMVEVPGKNYFIGKYQVTQALWGSVMGNNPSKFTGSSRPVEQVSWFDCVEFCNKLSEQEGLEKAYTINGEEVQCNFDLNGYRLPTEEEWEFAAKANQDFEHSGSDYIDEVAWTRENSNRETHGVGQKKANGFGLYDMSGNVWEWCWDWYERDDEGHIPTEDSTSPSTGSNRVIAGGGWNRLARSITISCRGENNPSRRVYYLGFRFSKTIQ